MLVVLVRGLIQPLPAPIAAADNPGPARVPALAKMATWRDLGAGAGPVGVAVVRRCGRAGSCLCHRRRRPTRVMCRATR